MSRLEEMDKTIKVALNDPIKFGMSPSDVDNFLDEYAELIVLEAIENGVVKEVL